MVSPLGQYGVQFAPLWVLASLLLGPTILPAATPYQWGTKLRLANGAESLLVVHAKDGVEQGFSARMQLPLRGAAYQKITIWGTKYRSSKLESDCQAPCELAMPLHYGSPKLYAEYFDANNNKQRESEWYDVPQAAPMPLSSFTMPLEVIGFAPYRLPVRVSAQASANLTGTIRLYAKTHRLTYPGKGRVRVNGGAWLNIQRANVTLLDHARSYNFASSMDFSQDVLWWTMNLPSSTVRSGANIVEWEYAKEQKEQSGYRVLEFNFLEPEKAITQVSLAGTTATLTIPSHGYSTGDDVLIENFPGIAWRINRIHRNISVTGPNTFTFSVPNPKALSGTWTYPSVRASRLIVDADSFVNENPATWTAPTGADATAGQSAFHATSLRATDFPGEFITASCASCHAKDGRDLKYFAFSNRSIEVRSQFHGMSVQESRDIAAYIRAHSSTVPGRAWYSPYQPCPAADTVPVYEWSGACSEEEVLPNEMGMLEQLASNGTAMTASDWSPTRTDLHFRNARISFQLLSLFEWWPRIHPQDIWVGPNCGVYPTGCFATSDLKLGFDQIYEDLEAYCPGTGTQCQDRIAALGPDGRRMPFAKKIVNFRVLYGQTPYCVGNPADVECANRVATEQNQELVKTYSAAQWDAIKSWEVEHALQLGKYALTWYTDGGAENSRILRYGQFFGFSPNLMRARLNNAMAGILDGTGEAEKLVSMQWYHLAAVVRSQGNKCCANQSFDGIQPLDVGYTYGYFFDLDYETVNVNVPLVQALWLQQQFIRYKDTTPANGSVQDYARVWNTNILRSYIFSQQNFNTAWASIPAADRDAVRANLVDSSLTKWTAIFCGDEANGSAAPFTVAAWNALGGGLGGDFHPANYPRFPSLFDVGGLTAVNNVAHAAAYGGAYGLNSATRNRLATCGAAIWQGPSSTLNGAINNSQTTLTIAADGSAWPTSNVQVVIGSERINCTARSGSTFSGCTRGAESTTPASHSNGAAVQMRIRWAKYSSVSCPKTGDAVDCISQDLHP
jgi:hypothetical protein